MLRIRDYPNFYPESWFLPISDPWSRIPDATATTTKKRRGVFEKFQKIILANWHRIKVLFTQKNCLSSQKYGFGIRDPENLVVPWIPDPGIKKAPYPGSAPLGESIGYLLNLNVIFTPFCSFFFGIGSLKRPSGQNRIAWKSNGCMHVDLVKDIHSCRFLNSNLHL